MESQVCKSKDLDDYHDTFSDQDEDKVEERGLSPDSSEADSLQSGASGCSGQGRRKSSVCPQPLLPQATLLRSEIFLGSGLFFTAILSGLRVRAPLRRAAPGAM